jgi:conjugative relaxase-like TrwC/TraI family protein
MVASISARGGAQAALGYYAHLSADNYYTRGSEPPGRWAGAAADRLSLDGPVTESEFEATLNGRDPKTGEALVQINGRTHAAGWDMTFSAPKSVSVLWALSDESQREAIEKSHRAAIEAATRHLEQNAAWTRRGAGSRVREPTAGLLVAQFDHHTSRESDPQLHTHSFIFNLAPRRDGSWGSIVSRELYQAQKGAGAIYRNELARGLERQGYQLDRQADSFRVRVIPRKLEQEFSKRRRAIEEAARTHGYNSPKGMELAALRTRRPKHSANLTEQFKSWAAEAKSLGFELSREQQAESRALAASNDNQLAARRPLEKASAPTVNAMSPARTAARASQASKAQLSPAELGSRLGAAFLSLDAPSSVGSLSVALRDSSKGPVTKPSLDRSREYEAE